MDGPCKVTLPGGQQVIYMDRMKHAQHFKHELCVLEKFVEEWNASGEWDMDQPVQTLIVCDEFHKDEGAPYEPPHITVMLCKEKHWNREPKQSHAQVHLYCCKYEVSEGYEDYYICSRRPTEIRSPHLCEKITKAERNHLGCHGKDF